MNEKELKRLQDLDERIKEIAKSFGLLTTDILFEIVPAQRVIEGMSYRFPTNFSHWSFGRDYDRHRTIYEHTGTGIPYEQVWNFETPRAFCVDTNPLALNTLVIAHVYGHVDYFLGSKYLQHGRSFSDLAEEARHARKRFRTYEERYGHAEVERVIDAGMTIQWHQDPDPFAERLPEEEMRSRLLAVEQAKIASPSTAELARPLTASEIQEIDRELEALQAKTPVLPDYDLLGYIIEKSPVLKPWMRDVLTVIRNQARSLAPNMRTKGLDEGWATYWHTRIMRQLFREGLLSNDDHETYSIFHSGVLRQNRLQLNVYGVFSAFFEHVEESWDKGRFGSEYEQCRNAYQRLHWDTGANRGMEKIFDLRTNYSDRMAIEELFSDEFIHAQELYVYHEDVDPRTGIITYTIVEDRPAVIRSMLREAYTHYGTPLVYVDDGNHNKQQELRLIHQFTGYELDSNYAQQTLKAIYTLWGRPTHLLTMQRSGKMGQPTPFTYSCKS